MIKIKSKHRKYSEHLPTALRDKLAARDFSGCRMVKGFVRVSRNGYATNREACDYYYWGNRVDFVNGCFWWRDTEGILMHADNTFYNTLDAMRGFLDMARDAAAQEFKDRYEPTPAPTPHPSERFAIGAVENVAALLKFVTAEPLSFRNLRYCLNLRAGGVETHSISIETIKASSQEELEDILRNVEEPEPTEDPMVPGWRY